MKRRLFVVTGVIVVVLAIVLAIVASTSGYQTISVAQALEPSQRETRVQVTGTVVTDSYQFEGDAISFAVYDPDGNPDTHLSVWYDGGVSATFGNQVTAICTGRIDAKGVLICTELVTKCPSKYETATDALSVAQIIDYGTSIEGKPVKITGFVQPGSLSTVAEDERLILVDEASDSTLSIEFSGAMPDGIEDNSVLVVTGSLNKEGSFVATDIALREE